jgi:hypothetical protein
MRSVLFTAIITGHVMHHALSTSWSSSVHLVRSTTKITTSTSFNAAEASVHVAVQGLVVALCMPGVST